MTVSELLADLVKKFPKQRDVIESWGPQYQQRLQHAEGMRLAEAYMVLMTGWSAMFFPRPNEIAAQIPKTKYDQATDDDAISDAEKYTREMEQRTEAAISWWKGRGTTVATFREYNFRRKFGKPTVEDLVDIQVQTDVDARAAKSVTSGPMKAVGEVRQVRPNHVKKKPEDPRGGSSQKFTTPPPPTDDPTPVQSADEYGAEAQ